jgi:prepilin peptidase CpaA
MWVRALWEHDPQFIAIQWAVVCLAALAAAITDARSRRIPNALTAPLLLAGLIWAYGVGGLAGLADGASACLLLAAPYVVLFAVAGGGAGDAKLMGALGAWLGLVNGVVALACVSVAAVAMALALVLARKQARSVAAHVILMAWGGLFFLLSAGKMRHLAVEPSSDGRQKMPYGIAICVGMLMAAGGTLLWRVWQKT